MDWFRLTRAITGRSRSADSARGSITVTSTGPVPTPLVWGVRVRVTAAGVRAGLPVGETGVYLGKDATTTGRNWVVRKGRHTAGTWPATYWEAA